MHQQDCDKVAYGEGAPGVLCTCVLPASAAESSKPAPAGGLSQTRSYVEGLERAAAKAERMRRQDIAEKHFAPTLWARWKARLRLVLTRWKLSRQRRRLGHG